MGVDQPTAVVTNHRREWSRRQVCREDLFSLVVSEGSYRQDIASYTRQEDYIKINFWLSGQHTTVLDGFGQHDHDRPEVFITSCPPDRVKVDIVKQDSPVSVVAVCLRREFFPAHLGVGIEELPEPLRAIALPSEPGYAFCQFPLSADLVAAAQAILSAPFAVRSDPRYGSAKCVELMCLLLNLMSTQAAHKVQRQLPRRHERGLREAYELISRAYAQDLTLDQIAKEIGLNRVALTSGFRQLFGIPVYDFLQKTRMERAADLLSKTDWTIAQIAEAVGFRHSCNFSTAFRAHFGCQPSQLRRRR